MWDSACKLPTQLASGQSSCFCGAVIDTKGVSLHVHVAPHGSRVKFVEPNRFADPDAAARQLMNRYLTATKNEMSKKFHKIENRHFGDLISELLFRPQV
jgi:hypothetical protein